MVIEIENRLNKQDIIFRDGSLFDFFIQNLFFNEWDFLMWYVRKCFFGFFINR